MPKRPSLADSMRRLDAPAPAAAGPSPEAEPQGGEPREGRGYYAATRAGRKKVTVALEPEAHQQLKRLAVDRSQTVEVLLREAITDLFRKYGKAPIA